jgi:hypothetical protein
LGDGTINQAKHESARSVRYIVFFATGLNSALIDRIAECLGAKGRKPFHPVQTPPYSISTPEITVRDLKPDHGEQLRFIILASDGREPHPFV